MPDQACLPIAALRTVCVPFTAELKARVKETKAFVKLAADVGAKGVKLCPNGFHEEAGISKAQTLEQIGLA